MPQSAELGTHDLVLARLRRGEVERNGKTWNEVLLDPQLRHIKRVPHVLGSQRQRHGPVHRERQGGDYDIVARIHVVLRIQSEIVLAGVVDQIGMGRGELAVRFEIPAHTLEPTNVRTSTSAPTRTTAKTTLGVTPPGNVVTARPSRRSPKRHTNAASASCETTNSTPDESIVSAS